MIVLKDDTGGFQAISGVETTNRIVLGTSRVLGGMISPWFCALPLGR